MKRLKRRIVFAGILLTAALLLDLQRHPQNQLTGRMAVAGIHLYQATLSPLYARAGVRCRFVPTCSHYGEVCFQRFGAVRGTWLTMRRVLRCGPWTPIGTSDVPPVA